MNRVYKLIHRNARLETQRNSGIKLRMEIASVWLLCKFWGINEIRVRYVELLDLQVETMDYAYPNIDMMVRILKIITR